MAVVTLEVTFHERHDANDARKLFYTKPEYKAMKVASMRDVQTLREIASSLGSLDDSGEDCTMTMIGIEHLLTG